MEMTSVAIHQVLKCKRGERRICEGQDITGALAKPCFDQPRTGVFVRVPFSGDVDG
jgi:hypothetical protein